MCLNQKEITFEELEKKASKPLFPGALTDRQMKKELKFWKKFWISTDHIGKDVDCPICRSVS